MEGRGERCRPHDLAVGPDGRCVLCQKAAVAQEPSVEQTSLRNPLIWTAFAAGLLALAVVAKSVSRTLVRNETTSSPGADMRTTVAPPATAPDPTAKREPESPSPNPDPPPERPVPTPTATASTATVDRAPRQKQPTEEELRVALRRVSITMYSTDWCPSCKRARAWFRANGISVDDRDVDRNESARRAQLLLNPKGSVPTIDVDGEVLVGFGAESMENVLRRAATRRALKF